jgi:hypothetical protein
VPEDSELTELARLGLDFAFVLRGVLLDSQIAAPSPSSLAPMSPILS